MLHSIVDYVLQTSRKQHIQSVKQNTNIQSAISPNQQKLLQYFFSEHQQIKNKTKTNIGISQLKFSDITTQYISLSSKIHLDIGKKNIALDSQIYKLQTIWKKKNIPEFYQYYFMKFAYSNPLLKFQKKIFEENMNMQRENDSYTMIRKSIDARQICLTNIRKQSLQLSQKIIQQDLKVLQQEIVEKFQLRLKQRMEQKNIKISDAFDIHKNWKTRLELFFDSIFHLRKITLYVIQMIKKWKSHIYSLTDDPKRYHQRIIFYQSNANYFLKILIDNRFLADSILKKYINFGNHYDPFIIRPLILLQNNLLKNQQLVFYKLLNPKESQFQKIIKALEILAEQQYQQDSNNRFLNQKKNFGELDFKKKLSLSKLKLNNQENQLLKKSNIVSNILNKKSVFQKQDIQQTQNLKKFAEYKRNKYIRSQLNYLSANQKRIKSQYQSLKSIENQKQSLQNSRKRSGQKIFNKYIEESIRKLQQLQKQKKYTQQKLYLKKNNRQYSQPKLITKNQSYKSLLLNQKNQLPFSIQPKGISAQINSLNNNKGSKLKVKTSADRKQQSRKGTIQSIFQMNQKQQYKKLIKSKMYGESERNNEDIKITEFQKRPQIIVLRQQPQKLEQIKQFLYTKLKQQLMQKIIKQNEERSDNIKTLMDDERKKRIEEMYEKKLQQQRRQKQQQNRKIFQQIQRQRNKINKQIEVQLVQYSQQNLKTYIQKILNIKSEIYNNLFNTNINQFLKKLSENLYTVFFKLKLKDQIIGYAFAYYDDQDIYRRKYVISYVCADQDLYFLNIVHHVIHHIWKHDPAQQILLILFDNGKQSQINTKLIHQISEYTKLNGQLFQKNIYTNINEKTFLFIRNQQQYPDGLFKGKNSTYNRSLFMKVQILSSNLTLTQTQPSKVNMNLQQKTHYIFLIQQMFRNYLTPQQVIQLRQNSQNLRKLKDIFRIIIQLSKNKPQIQQLKIIQALNLDDLNDRIRMKTTKPYEKYYWRDYFDKLKDNHILLAILEIKLQFKYVINSASMNGINFMKIKTNEQILLLKSSIYAQDLIYILPTKNQKLKFFIVRATLYKSMRIELFTFLNLLFNNIIYSFKEYFENIWIPQIYINDGSQNVNKFNKKQITRITDFSITMKKNVWLSQQIYFCNRQYLKNGISYVAQKKDQIFMNDYIYGVIHNDIEKQSVGFPIFGKLIERQNIL